MATIMLVDDIAFIKLVQKEVLEKEGYEIVADASDGVDAIEKYKKFKPDVVIMDITMPKLDGINAIKSILQIDPNARIVVCSAIGQHQLVIDAIKAGAKDFVIKPFEPQRLALAIKKALK